MDLDPFLEINLNSTDLGHLGVKPMFLALYSRLGKNYHYFFDLSMQHAFRMSFKACLEGSKPCQKVYS